MNEDAPIKLKHAAEEYGIPVGELRAEATRGNLTIYRIGRTHYTTANDIREMIAKCRVEQKAPGSISFPRRNSGSSETERASSALAAANEIALRLKNSSRGTSGVSINRNRRVRP